MSERSQRTRLFHNQSRRWFMVTVVAAVGLLGISVSRVLAQRTADKQSKAAAAKTALDGVSKKAAGKSESSLSDATSPSDRSPDDRDGTAQGASDQDNGKQASPSSRPTRQDMLVASLAIFLLAVFVGFEVITKVPPTLHTPLMSGSNAISGITIVGALIVAGEGWGLASFLGFVAVILATINVVGGFLVTHRMLAMFKKR